jgi:hypothetical protein
MLPSDAAKTRTVCFLLLAFAILIIFLVEITLGWKFPDALLLLSLP